MPSRFDQKDSELVQSVTDELIKRRNANINSTVGKMPLFYGTSTDEIFPQVSINKKDICDGTGRTKVRGSVFLKLKKDFEDQGLIANIMDDKLKVEIPTEKSEQTSFNSFNALKQANIETEEEYQNKKSMYETEESFKEDDPFKDPYL